MTRPLSLGNRLLLTAVASLLAAIVVSAALLWFGLDRVVRSQIDGRLDAQIATVLLAAPAPDPGDRRLGLDPPPFDRPGSGWYWQYRVGAKSMSSASLAGGRIEFDAPGRGRSDRPRSTEAIGPRGEALWTRVQRIEGGFVMATAPMSAIWGPLGRALGIVAATLLAVMAVLAVALVVQVRLGLRPLRRLEGDLAAVRAGEAAEIQGDQPTELRNVVAELNALLRQNREGLARARTHLANLAHALKTPLATVVLGLSQAGIDADGRLRRQVEAIDRRVAHHLRRARSAALAGPTRTRTNVRPRIDDLRTVLLALYAEKGVDMDVDGIATTMVVACEPEDLDEILGNVLDNACKWCRRRIRISGEMGRQAVLLIDDDGAGLQPEHSAIALLPGRRLDEGMPGTGFGLPITTELAELYGGSLGLEASPLGGLRVRLVLPGASS